MAVTEVDSGQDSQSLVRVRPGDRTPGGAEDLQANLQFLLATVWLLDAVLQIQPFMFTRGSNGFSGMLNGLASGNPSWVAHTITWNGSIVYHQPILTNTVFAGIQFLIGFGIVCEADCKPALASPSSGPSACGGSAKVPAGSSREPPLRSAVAPAACCSTRCSPCCCGRARDRTALRGCSHRRAEGGPVHLGGGVGLLALLSVVGSGRSPQALHDLVAGMNSGQPGWLAHIDRVSESFFLHHGTPAAILLAVVCLIVAVGRASFPRGRPGHPGPGHRGLRRHLGGRPELRWDPGRRRHRPQLRAPGHRAGPHLLAPDRHRNSADPTAAAPGTSR